MFKTRLHRLAGLAAMLIVLAATALAQQPRTAPSSPSVVAPPKWSRVMKMPDGRTFVSDGALSIDAALAKPADLSSLTLIPAGGKLMTGYFTAPYDKEVSLGDLSTGAFKNSFATPDGVTLNGNYVSFLRRTLPVARTRLRTKGTRDAVVIMMDGQAVGVMMPLAPPSPPK